MDRLAVRLRPFDEGDLWYFDRFAAEREFSAPFEWIGFTSPQTWRSRWHEDRLLGKSPYCLVVAAGDDDSFVGCVDWRQDERGGPGVWEIGILLAQNVAIPSDHVRQASIACGPTARRRARTTSFRGNDARH